MGNQVGTCSIKKLNCPKQKLRSTTLWRGVGVPSGDKSTLKLCQADPGPKSCSPRFELCAHPLVRHHSWAPERSCPPDLLRVSFRNEACANCWLMLCSIGSTSFELAAVSNHGHMKPHFWPTPVGFGPDLARSEPSYERGWTKSVRHAINDVSFFHAHTTTNTSTWHRSFT